MVADTPDFTGAVTIDGGTIDIEPGASVSIDGIVTANVVPKVTYLGNFTSGHTDIDTSLYNTLIINLAITATGYHATQYGYMELTASDSASGVALPPRFYYLQASSYNNNAGEFSNQGQTVFPLHGMDRLAIDFAVSDVGLEMSADIFGTTETLPEFHRTREFGSVSHILMFNANHVMPSGGSQFPVPVSCRPVRLYIHPHAANSGASQAIQVVDTVTGALIFNATVPKGSNLGQEGFTNPSQPYILLPHTMSPMTISTGSATSGDEIDVFVTDDV